MECNEYLYKYSEAIEVLHISCKGTRALPDMSLLVPVLQPLYMHTYLTCVHELGNKQM